MASLFKAGGRKFNSVQRYSTMRAVEFMGGPLDGRTPLVSDEQTTVAYTDGSRVFIYEREESFTGKAFRQVFRYVSVVPLPRREGEK